MYLLRSKLLDPAFLPWWYAGVCHKWRRMPKRLEMVFTCLKDHCPTLAKKTVSATFTFISVYTLYGCFIGWQKVEQRHTPLFLQCSVTFLYSDSHQENRQGYLTFKCSFCDQYSHWLNRLSLAVLSRLLKTSSQSQIWMPVNSVECGI